MDNTETKNKKNRSLGNEMARTFAISCASSTGLFVGMAIAGTVAEKLTSRRKAKAAQTETQTETV